MAAAGGPVRLRLLFDHPPPGSPGCALCWLLLEPSQVRLVTDLLSLIRHRFGFSRRARLSLFLDGALLPPTESARLVRDNDSLRVKLEEVVADYEEIDDGFSYTPKEDKKRHRQKQEDFSRNEERHKREKKKKKHNAEYSSSREETSVDIQDSLKRYKKRKRKEEVSGRNREGKEESSTDQSKKLKKAETEKQLATKRKDEKQTKAAAAKMALERVDGSSSLNSGKNDTKKITTQSRKKRLGSSDSSSTSSDSDSNELNVKQNKSPHKPVVATLPKDKSQAAANSDVKTVVSNKVTVKSNAEKSTKTAISKSAKKSQSSSSDSDSSTEDEKAATAQAGTAKEKSLPNNVAAVKTGTTKAPKAKTSSSESDSSDSETLVIKKPTANAGLNNSMVRNCTKPLLSSVQGPLASSGRGRGRGTAQDSFWGGPRGRGFRGMMRGQGRGRGANFFYNYSSEGQKQRQLNESATNTSVLVQNPVEVPKRDYSMLPLLAAPPQVGERIAFKRLELTENYSPEVSDYKEGKIISWNADKKEIELEILSSSAGQFAKEPGKFDLVYQSADGAELIEYAVPQDTKITESWDALIEPRLIVEPPVNGSSIENGTI
ncbi:coilin [Caloenas nicobarica]|uniref:coilin n=1 Tax=Caloenas nicobarica TaxID=187106 RepID=UPI0032B87FEC